MTVYENIAFVLRVIDAPRRYIRKRVPYVISLVGLQDKSNSYPTQLSGGEQQRVAIARALVNDPKIEETGQVLCCTGRELMNAERQFSWLHTNMILYAISEAEL